MLNRYSSRRQKLSTSLLNARLNGAKNYDRIAGYFATSLFDVSGEAIDLVEGKIRIICNAHLQIDDVRSIKSFESSLRKDWCDSNPEQNRIEHPARLKKLYELLRSGKLEVKVLPDEIFGFIHGKAGVITTSDGSKTSFLGSMNESQSGWERNYELVWEDTDNDSIQWVQEEFDALWNHESARQLIDFVVEDILRIADRKIIYQIEQITRPEESVVESPVYRRGLGLWEHQKYFIDLVYRTHIAGTKARYINADMVGLGKTIQLGLSAQILSLHSDKPVLVIAPKTLLWQWQDELQELMGLPSAVWDGKTWTDEQGNQSGGRSTHEIKKCPRKIGIVSQGIMTANSDASRHLLDIEYNTVIVDECHRARRKNLGQGKENDKPVPNNLYDYLLRISKKTEHMLMGTATPIQIFPIEAWDLLNILSQGDDKVMGSQPSLWRSNPSHALDVLSGKKKLKIEYEIWDWMRNPLGDKFDNPTTFGILRDSLDMKTTDYFVDKQYDELSLPQKNIVDKLSPDFAERHNPFIARIVRRTRKYLEETINPATNEPYLLPIKVKLFGEQASDSIKLPLYLQDAYSKAEEIAKDMGKKNSGFITTLILRRVGSSMYAGKMTAEKMLIKSGKTASSEQLDLMDDEAFDDEDGIHAVDIDQSTGSALREFLSIISDKIDQDPKYDLLIKILKDQKWSERGCVIFSQYYDTIYWFAEKLVKSGNFNDLGVGVYAGGDKSGMYIDGAFVKRPKEQLKKLVKTGEIKILFGTDAASEGLNLQTLGTLINIDLPWNPTRLEQRKGRIQRIGQKHDEVWIHNMRYKDSVEDKVHKVLATRLKAINEVFGQIPDVLEDVWTLVAKDEVEKARKIIDEVPKKSPFEAKYENPKMNNSYNWEACSKVLDEYIKVEHFRTRW